MKPTDLPPGEDSAPANTAKPRAAKKVAPPARKQKRVAYTVKLSTSENQQLTELRDLCRSAGLRVSKAKLLRAAVVFMNEQTSASIEAQLKQLVPLKAGRKK